MRLPSSSSPQVFTTLLVVILAAAISTGCGASGSMSKTPPLTGSTAVTVVVSSTANDQLAEFDLGFQNISLTIQAVKTVTVMSMPTSGPPLGAEFMHTNGTAEPLVTASIPQGVYTSMTVTPGVLGAVVCVALGPSDGEQVLDTATYNATPSPVSVNLASPLTVTGASMALSLDLLVAQSATIGDCVNVDGFYGYTITPTFSLAPLMLSSLPTNSANGKVTGLDGEITAISTSGSVTLSLPDVEGPRPLSVGADSNTVYQGISGLSTLAVGTFIDMDGAIQSDGSVLATRIAVEDPTAGDVLRGPLIEVAPSVSVLSMHPRQEQGKDLLGFGGGSFDFKFGSAIFQTSGQLTNLQSLPFVPSFNASNVVPGQEVYISAAVMPPSGYPVATTLTLMPQTINGTVAGSSTSGNFTDYTVSLASYDLFPMLAVQPGQTVENNPSQVEVYVDSNTQMLNTQALATGNTLRFYGLVFNDNGTLRMDCAQVNDGVPFSPPPSASQQAHMEKGAVQQVRRENSATQQVISVTTNQK